MSIPDEIAYKKIYDTRAERLQTIQARAEKWIAGLTALVTILTTAMVVKGPDNFTKVDPDQRTPLLIAIIVGGTSLAVGLVAAYSAAFGGLFAMSEIDSLLKEPPTTDTGAAERLETAATNDTTTSRRNLRTALGATTVGMVALTVAVVISWTSPATGPGGDRVCAVIGGEQITFSATPTVEAGKFEFIKCAD